MPFQLGDFILGHAIDVTAKRVREVRFHEVVHCILDLDVLSFQVATLAFGDSTLRLNKSGQSENGIDWQITKVVVLVVLRFFSTRFSGILLILAIVVRCCRRCRHRTVGAHRRSAAVVICCCGAFAAVLGRGRDGRAAVAERESQRLHSLGASALWASSFELPSLIDFVSLV